MLKYALFIVIVNANPADNGQDSWWAIDGNLTESDCETALQEKEPHLRALYGGPAVAYPTCDVDHAPEEW